MQQHIIIIWLLGVCIVVSSKEIVFCFNFCAYYLCGIYIPSA